MSQAGPVHRAAGPAGPPEDHRGADHQLARRHSHHRNRGLGRGPHHPGHHPGERPDFADPGGPRNAGAKGPAAAIRLQPRRRQRHRRLPQGAQPRSLQQADRGPHEGTAGPRRHRAEGFPEQRGGLQRRHHRRAEQPAGAAHLRHHQPGHRRGGEAGIAGQYRTRGALAHRRRHRAEAGLAGHGDSGRTDGLLRRSATFPRSGCRAISSIAICLR